MLSLTERTKSPPSAIRAILQQIAEMDGIINLSIGQPHLPPNPVVYDKLAKALQSHALSFHYSPSQGRPETLDAIVKLYNYYYPTVAKFTTEEVMATNGGSQALWNAFSILIEKGDAVLTFAPYFSTYRSQIEALGGTLKTISTMTTTFRPEANALEAMLNADPTIKMVILNYPNNPTGVALTLDEVTALADVLNRHPHVAIIIDDVYRDLNYVQHYTVVDVVPQLKERTIIINSGAKGLVGAPDMRIGMAAANPAWIKAMCQQQVVATSGVTYLAQLALIYAVEDLLENLAPVWLPAIRAEYENNIKTTAAELEKYGFTVPNKSEGAFYLFVNAKHLMGREIPVESGVREKTGFSYIKTDLDLVNYFIYAAGVATVPGSGFGMSSEEGLMRISCAKDNAVLMEAATKLGKAAKMLLKPALVTNSLFVPPDVDVTPRRIIRTNSFESK